jgi:cytoskeletal protein CcmA (bactofilin family)
MENEPSETASTRFRPEISRRSPEIPGMARPGSGGESERMPETEKQLIVGKDIVLSGQIASCDKLVVEGTVEAQLEKSKVIEILESGLFKGTADIEDAMIAGRFEGDLTVHGLLTIHSTGRITGEIRYGRLAVDEGGVISGDIQTITAGAAQPLQRPVSAPPIAAETGNSAAGAGGDL